jgi:hypothetical protein
MKIEGFNYSIHRFGRVTFVNRKVESRLGVDSLRYFTPRLTTIDAGASSQSLYFRSKHAQFKNVNPIKTELSHKIRKITCNYSD